MRRIIICIFLLLLLILNSLVFAFGTDGVRFTDIQDHWAKESIDYVVEKGVMNGTSVTEFSPDMELSRGMFMTVIAKYAGVDLQVLKNETNFIDVPADSYYAAAIAWAKEVGLVSGVDSTHFEPDRPMLREEVVFILYRYAGKMGYDTSGRVNMMDYYIDFAMFHSYAQEAGEWSLYHGILTAILYDRFMMPQVNITRAETAVLLAQFDKIIAVLPD